MEGEDKGRGQMKSNSTNFNQGLFKLWTSILKIERVEKKTLATLIVLEKRLGRA